MQQSCMKRCITASFETFSVLRPHSPLTPAVPTPDAELSSALFTVIVRCVNNYDILIVVYFLPWSFIVNMPCACVVDSITEGEQRAMMESLRSATQNTMFEQWLDATMRPAVQPNQDKSHQHQV